jgi:hypothetical protein
VLLAKCPYAGGIFFDYLQWWFIAIARDAGGHWAPVMGADGRPEMYESAPLMSQYLALVSSNFVQEIFQPDEILAQNFVLMASQPSLDILVEMRGALSSKEVLV